MAKRQLNQQTASVLAHATQHGTVIVTERGTRQWTITAFTPSTLSALEYNGRYIPAENNPTPWPKTPTGPAYSDSDIDTLLDDIRGDH